MAEKENKKNKGLGLPETKGSFQITGIVSGTEKDKFYIEKLTQTEKPYRAINFGVQFDKDSTIYLNLNGMEQKEVFFSKRVEKDGKTTTETQRVPWKDRFTFKEKDFKLIGVNVGVKKIKDDKGNDVNDKKILTQYDACKEIGDNLVDNKSVFTRGNVEYGSYNGKRIVKFVPNQVSLCKDVNFDDEEFKPTADFTQTIIFTGITPNEDKTKFTVSAKIVTYNSVEDAEFIILNPSLASTFKKNIKPYTSIKVWGSIHVEKDTEEVVVDDGWGEENKMDKINSPTIRELVIKGADKESIDTTTYTEKELDKAIAKIKANEKAKEEYGNNSSSGDSWGSVGSLDDDDDTPWE